jgi:hypothetical protein
MFGGPIRAAIGNRQQRSDHMFGGPIHAAIVNRQQRSDHGP